MLLDIILVSHYQVKVRYCSKADSEGCLRHAPGSTESPYRRKHPHLKTTGIPVFQILSPDLDAEFFEKEIVDNARSRIGNFLLWSQVNNTIEFVLFFVCLHWIRGLPLCAVSNMSSVHSH